MALAYPNLLSPIKVGNTVLRNRMIALPTGLTSQSNGELYPTAEAIAHFANRARGGAALVTAAGATFVPAKDDGRSEIWDLYSSNHLNALGHLAETIHVFGAKASVELHNSSVPTTEYSVSDGVPLADGRPGKEMPESEMIRLAQCYASAAAAAKEAGMDGICLHFGHGWQVAQFLSPLTNKRTDKYGGSLENQARFPAMIIDAIRAKVGKNLLIEMRISGSELEEGSLTLEDSIGFVEMIQDRIDLVHVSAGIHNPKWMTVMHPCGFLPPIPNVYLAEAFKKSGRIHIPIAALGGIQNLDEAEEIIREGCADIVGIARGFIADNELGTKAYEGRGDDVTPCIKCMRCHDSTIFGHQYLCTVNPVIGMEHKLEQLIRPAVRSRKTAVVGGGPAGMKAALTLAERGHKVVLYEERARLGGNIVFADYVSFKYPLANYKQFLIRQVEKSAIDVRLNTKATPELLKKEQYDAIIVALGAEPSFPPIPGIRDDGVLSAVSIYGKEEQLGDTVIVVGGGQVGCETALHLAKLGKQVQLLEAMSDLAPDASRTHRLELMNELHAEKNLTITTGALGAEITPGSVTYRVYVPEDEGLAAAMQEMTYGIVKVGGGDASTANIIPLKDSGETRTVTADNVIIATGMRGRTEEGLMFHGAADIVIPVGDCVRARTVENAVREAFYAASRI